jgi:hypothetical protein
VAALLHQRGVVDDQDRVRAAREPGVTHEIKGSMPVA